ncbi:LacI family DNA-binding transcriptional regulator [Curtobacterium pusillum]|uniref:LacI family DNA-binding transcriptional regulator n=1 Tax=Curtobacterium pusillum TaxID=69373 RepID=A0ABX2MBQ6_9MICO|nr:LacI family DNA-binding transcriptional regulator [Curtobacterium pusillum]NUU14228.1 LacI family DNA-binding transcriptional regulator [Curtobacterium pusillum]GLK30663.1 LacI family transcriptional regulator [Curtobacterium pusillum]
MRDVADRADVSKSLVSLAYRSPASVSPHRLERILAAAAELGYRPNRVARSLNGAREDFVGILVADTRNPVLTDVVESARATLADAGRLGLVTSAVLPSPSSGSALDVEVVAMLGDLQPSGLLVVGSVPDMDRVVEMTASARLVIASGRPGSRGGLATVRGDDEVGMRLVVDHLTALGHRRIGHVGGEGGPVAAGRASAFAGAMREHGLDAGAIAPSDFTERAGHRAASALLDSADPPTAIAAVNDLAAIGVLAAVAERGLSGTVAVTGYDNTYLAALGPIDLTSVDPHNDVIGRRAAELLLAPGHVPASDDGVLVAPSLAVRGSSTTVV